MVEQCIFSLRIKTPWGTRKQLAMLVYLGIQEVLMNGNILAGGSGHQQSYQSFITVTGDTIMPVECLPNLHRVLKSIAMTAKNQYWQISLIIALRRKIVNSSSSSTLHRQGKGQPGLHISYKVIRHYYFFQSYLIYWIRNSYK